MSARDAYPELVGMVHRLYDELTGHDHDYHHRTDRRLLMDVREFLVAVGELPTPEPIDEELPGPADTGEEDAAELGAAGEG